MIKYVVVALLFASVLTGRLTPGTKLGFAFDNMLSNNVAAGEEKPNGIHTVSKELQTKEVYGYILSQLRWVNRKSVLAIEEATKKLDEKKIESHYVFQAFPRASLFKYALINLIKDGQTFKIVISQGQRRAFGIRVANILHDVMTSTLGLPFEGEAKVVQKTGNEAIEFHKANREELFKEIKTIRGSQFKGSLGFDIAGTVSKITGVVNSITSTWQNIVSAFKTINKEEFKEKIGGEGFDRYLSRSRFIRSLGIPMSKWEIYKGYYAKLLGYQNNPNVKSYIEDVLALSNFIPDNSWTLNDFTFDKDKGGKCNSVVAISSRDYVEDLAHIVTVVVDGSFSLSPDIFVWTKFKSVAGGITESTKDEMRNVPRGLKTGEVKAIHALMIINMLQVLSDNFAIGLKLPETKF